MVPETKQRDPDEYYNRREKSADETFCQSCGSIIKKVSDICPQCGASVHIKPNYGELVAILTILYNVLLIIFLIALGLPWQYLLVPISLSLSVLIYFIIKTTSKPIKGETKSE